MILKCNVDKCGYNKDKKCTKFVVGIQENGTCDWLYYKNIIRPGFDEP